MLERLATQNCISGEPPCLAEVSFVCTQLQSRYECILRWNRERSSQTSKFIYLQLFPSYSIINLRWRCMIQSKLMDQCQPHMISNRCCLSSNKAIGYVRKACNAELHKWRASLSCRSVFCVHTSHVATSGWHWSIITVEICKDHQINPALTNIDFRYFRQLGFG